VEIDIIELIGYSGGIAFALCAIPEAWASYRRGYATISWGMLLLWIYGELATLLAVMIKAPELFLIINYVGNIIFTAIILYYKLKVRK